LSVRRDFCEELPPGCARRLFVAPLLVKSRTAHHFTKNIAVFTARL